MSIRVAAWPFVFMVMNCSGVGIVSSNPTSAFL